MGAVDRFLRASHELDQAVYRRTGLNRLVAGLPDGFRRVFARYGPFLTILLLLALIAAALNLTGGGTRLATGKDSTQRGLGDGGGLAPDGAEANSASSAGAASARGGGSGGKLLAKGQRAQLPTTNICGDNGRLVAGKTFQFPFAVQCVEDFSSDNGGNTSRGVTQGEIHVAYYLTSDPQIISTTRAGGGCGDYACWNLYVKTFNAWFDKYYQTYGRKVILHEFRGGGREGDVNTAIADARSIASMNPPVFAVLGGPGEAGAAFAEELKANGIICMCTVSLPRDFYARNGPYVWGQLMSSTQAYIHRAQYIGQRLWNQNAKFGADEVTKNSKRVFGLVWFDNTQGNYKSGVDFFEDELAKYGASLKVKIRYENIEGCQKDAGTIIQALSSTTPAVTSVVFSGDPICPISLTKAAQLQLKPWEWIITGSVLSDTNNLARLYDRDQWARAFGVSMLSPDVKNANDWWYKMFKEIEPGEEPAEDAQLFPGNITTFYTGIHLATANLKPSTFRDGLASAIPTGGTPTLPRTSYGPKTLGGISFFDYLRFDDMTEIWWDNNASDPNGNARAYRYVDGAKRYTWGNWPNTPVKAFDPAGTVTGFDKPPDQ